ncbi:hypothetical protein YQE_11254, partial [Dendroctonus ponderosae]
MGYKRAEGVKAQLRHARVKLKHLVEAAGALRGLSVNRAQAYLADVLARRRCVPFRRFKGGVGRCRQAKQFRTVQGRWPMKAARCLRGLLRSALANAEHLGRDPDELKVGLVQANAAPIVTRNTFRAHGRINPYRTHPSHIQLVLTSL